MAKKTKIANTNPLGAGQLTTAQWEDIAENYKQEQINFKRFQEEQRLEIEQLKEQIKLLTNIIKS